MKKILVMPDGNWLSHVSRPLEVARALRAGGGVEIVFAGQGEYMRLPAEAGFPIVEVATLDPAHTLRCSRSGRVNWWTYEHVQALVAADLEVLAAQSPDLVLTDFRLTLSTSCELAQVPLAVLLNASWTNHYTAKVRAPEHLALTRVLGRPLMSLLLPLVKSAILQLDSRPFRRFRREHGLAPRGNIWDIWRGDLNLLVDTPSYGPTEDLPDDFRYVGPIIWEPDLPTPAWLEALDPGRPVLYFTMGSTGYARFFERAVELFGDTDVQGIMTTAGLVDFPSLPSNFHAVDYAPGSRLMDKSDVVICQGGNGTIYQALSHGVPIIGIPTMHDQEFNLDRVAALGAGIHLSELRFRPEHLTEAVAKVLGDPSYRQAASAQQAILEEYDGPRRAAEVVRQWLERR